MRRNTTITSTNNVIGNCQDRVIVAVVDTVRMADCARHLSPRHALGLPAAMRKSMKRLTTSWLAKANALLSWSEAQFGYSRQPECGVPCSSCGTA